MQEGAQSLQMWYSNLCRLAIYPRMLFDYDAEGNPFPYSPNDPKGQYPCYVPDLSFHYTTCVAVVGSAQ